MAGKRKPCKNMGKNISSRAIGMCKGPEARMGRGIWERTERDHGGLEQSKTGQWGESGRRKQKKGLFCFVLFCFWLMSFNPHNYLLYLRRGRTWDSGRFSACPRVTQLIRSELPSHWWVYRHQSEGTGKAGRTHLRGTPPTSRPCLKLTSNSQSCQSQGKQHAL